MSRREQVGFCHRKLWMGYGYVFAGLCNEPAYGPTEKVAHKWRDPYDYHWILEGGSGKIIDKELRWACPDHGGAPKCPETEFIRDALMAKEATTP